MPFRLPGGAALKSVQFGTTTPSDGTSSINVTITPVDLSRTVLYFTTGGGANVLYPGLRGYLSASNTIVFDWGDTARVPWSIYWFVVEFSSGVTVQHGTDSGAGCFFNVTISAVDRAKSFALASAYTSGASPQDTRAYLPDISLPASTTVRLRRNCSYSTWDNPGTWFYAWQVVSFN
jgi:hypothetical protein